MTDDKDKTAEEWTELMKRIDDGDTEKWDEAKDVNEGVSFDDFELSIPPEFAATFLAAD
jgi:hypothetical protein